MLLYTLKFFNKLTSIISNLKMDELRLNDSCNTLSHYEQDIIDMLGFVGGAVSILFCLVILFITLLLRKYQQSTQRVIIYLTLCVGLSSICYVLPGITRVQLDSNYCVAVAFLNQVTSWMVLLAVCCLTCDLFIKVVFLQFDTSRFEPLYCVIIFVVPFVFNWIPFVHHAYGSTGALCWIKQSKPDNCTEIDSYYISLRFALYWAPFLFLQLAISVAYSIIFIKTRLRLREFVGKFDPEEIATRKLLYREVRWYMLYPVFLSITFIAGIVSRIAEPINLNNSFFWLRVMHMLVISLQGLGIAIIFALDYDTRTQLTKYHTIKLACYSLVCCCKRQKVSEYEVISANTDSLNSQRSNKISSKDVAII